MSYRRVIAMAAGALALLLTALVGVYVANFGLTVSGKQEIWGQFGDYFGGVLNPVLSSIGLLATLCVVVLQINTAAEMRLDRRRDELSELLRTIEVALDRRLNVNLAPAGAIQSMTMRQLVHEAERLKDVDPKPGALGEFVGHARASGSVVWAEFRDMRNEFLELVGALRQLVSIDHGGSHRQIVEVAGYYVRKYGRLEILIGDVEPLAIEDAHALSEMGIASRRKNK